MDMINCPKCEEEHEPTGSHEDDAGEFECQECGFKFNVVVEYSPEYYTYCIEHEFGEYKMTPDRHGELVNARFCKYCQTCEIKETDVAIDKRQG